jgi:hypothetical protein
LERIGNAAYKLELPEESQIDLVFHVSQLKPFFPDYTLVFSDLPQVAELDAKDLVPDKILDTRMVKKGEKVTPQVLVKWSKLPQESVTWEDWYVLQDKFPGGIAGGPTIAEGAGDVMTKAIE